MTSIKSIKLKTLVSVSLFALFTGWWVVLNYIIEPSDNALEIFSGTYGVLALVGSIYGFKIAKSWGGRKSAVGRSLLLFSLGLLAQVFGQISYSAYTFLFDKEIPYPSIGDVGYMGSVILYIFGTIALVRSVTSKHVLSSYSGRLKAFFIPVALLIFSYVEFLRNYDYSNFDALTTALDFGYPFGQAIYVSLAILAYTLSRKYLGGAMRSAVRLLIIALLIQYIADFTFLYQTNNETWTTAGINDYFYALSYLFMTGALLSFGKAYAKLSTNSDSAEVK